jgi:cell division cycle 2-like protein
MSAQSKSRWADSEQDAELEAKIKREKEEKRRKKAEKVRKLEEEKQAAAAAAAAAKQQEDGDDRPSKRRKLTPEAASSANDDAATKLLRFDAGGWSASRSVENYDKLNDIEEGTYGWVARATQRSSGKVVALKRLKLDPADRNGLPVTGLREIQILQDCRHRNIVPLEEIVVGENTSKVDKYVPRVLWLFRAIHLTHAQNN